MPQTSRKSPRFWGRGKKTIGGGGGKKRKVGVHVMIKRSPLLSFLCDRFKAREGKGRRGGGPKKGRKKERRPVQRSNESVCVPLHSLACFLQKERGGKSGEGEGGEGKRMLIGRSCWNKQTIPLRLKP